MWLEFHDSARSHPKILKLAKDLGIEEAHSLGHVAALWAWTLTMAPDGDLSSFDYEDIELGAKWKGESGAFVRAAIDRKLLDKIDDDADMLKLHNWEIYAQHLKAAQRKREERARKRQKSQDVTGHHETSRDAGEGSRDVTGHHETSRDAGEGSRDVTSAEQGVTGTDRPTGQTDQTEQTGPARAREAPPGSEDSPNPGPEDSPPWLIIVRIWRDVGESVTGRFEPVDPESNRRYAEKLYAMCIQANSGDPLELAGAVFGRYWKRKHERGQTPTMRFMVEDFGQYLHESPKARPADRDKIETKLARAEALRAARETDLKSARIFGTDEEQKEIEDDIAKWNSKIKELEARL